MYPNNRWLVLAIVTSTLFLIVIDMTVLYTALPRIMQDLDGSAAEKLWIINAYPLVVAGLLPGAGMLSDRLGHKRLFITGLPLFALASWCAAFSPTAGLLIASRVFLAVGAAMMMPATLAIVRQVFIDERERALAIGIWAAVASGAAALGPVLGGLLLEYFWWGSVFLINVPVVAVVLPFACWLIPHCGGNRQRPFDLVGSLQIMLGLVGVVFALKELSNINASLLPAVASAAVGALFLTLFVRRQQRAAQPMIDFTLFRNGGFSGGVVIAIVSGIALTGVELVLTQRLQLVLGLSPLMSALMLLPLPVASVLASPLAGVLLPRYGERTVILYSFTVCVLGIISLLALFNSALVWQMLALFAAGSGLGAMFTAASTSIMLNTPEEKAGMVAAIEDVSWELGGVLGVTLLGGMMTAVYSYGLTLPDGLVNGEAAYDSIDEALRIAAGMGAERAERLIGLAQNAFDRAYLAVLSSAAVLLLITFLVLRRVLRPAHCPGQ
ncbi:MFS transporter [Erwinia sp. SLM-02]|uniref:MFS transporter n=1 Tax=Erwinia sp. SLM-02 TaxID=3020057 RepID=UPI003080183F